ncbi:EamA family transporter RarD [Lentzea sp.]|uniref:EamA family transporter RarD n=1 Tax=Lentzea sp. TaxID=56099 RepID=UPI002ED01635
MTTSFSRAGVAASLGASALFGGIFVLPSLLRPLDPVQILGYRVVAMIGLLALLFSARRMWGEFPLLLRRLRERPWLVGVLAADAAQIGVQMWLFGWAPQTGHGLEVSLGYLLLPLTMVVVGVVVHRERLSPWRTAAVLCACAGAVAAVVLSGGLGWATVLVALGMPLYLVTRRAFALDSFAAQLLELVLLLPFAAVVLVTRPSLELVAGSPRLAGALLLLGVLSAGGFTLYLTAGRLLPFTVFGVLSYVEPVLLVVVALAVLGEPWRLTDVFTYAPICVGLALLAVDAHLSRVRHRDLTAVA